MKLVNYQQIKSPKNGYFFSAASQNIRKDP